MKLAKTALKGIGIAVFTFVIICGSYYITYMLLGATSIAAMVGTALIALACISTITFSDKK
jgi:hypothetical protein